MGDQLVKLFNRQRLHRNGLNNYLRFLFLRLIAWHAIQLLVAARQNGSLARGRD
jgi:hypothetical protein